MQVSTSLSATGLGDILNLLSQDGPIDLACGAGQSTFNLISGVINEQSVWTSAKRSSSEHARRQVFLDKSEKSRVCSHSMLVSYHSKMRRLISLPARWLQWHWLDLSTVFPEINRVLKSPGALVVTGYCIPGIHINDQCNKMFQDLIRSTDITRRTTWQHTGGFNQSLQAR